MENLYTTLKLRLRWDQVLARIWNHKTQTLLEGAQNSTATLENKLTVSQLEILLLHHLEIILVGVLIKIETSVYKNVYKNVHNNFISNNHRIETAQMYIKREIHQQISI